MSIDMIETSYFVSLLSAVIYYFQWPAIYILFNLNFDINWLKYANLVFNYKSLDN